MLATSITRAQTMIEPPIEFESTPTDLGRCRS